MPILQLSNEQVIDLVKQLPPEQQRKVYEYLLFEQWPAWEAVSNDAQDGARRAATERGRDWTAMTEEERLDFIDVVVHEELPPKSVPSPVLSQSPTR